MRIVSIFILGLLLLPATMQGDNPPSQEGGKSRRIIVEPRSWENHNPEELPGRAIARLGSLGFRHNTCYAGHPMAISSDGKLIITGGDQRIRFWDYPSGKLVYEYCHAYSHVFNLVLSSDDRWLVGRYDRCFVMDVTQRKMLREFGDKATMPLCFSPDSKYLVTFQGKELVWYSTAGWEVEKRWQLPEHVERVDQAQFLEKGTVLQTIKWYDKQVISYWNVASGKLIEEHTIQLPVKQRTATYSKDGKELVVVPYSREAVQIYDIKTGRKLRELQGELTCSLYGLVFSPDGKTLLTNWFKDDKVEDGSKGFRVALWGYETGTLKRSFPVKGENDYRFFPDGRTLLTSSGAHFDFYNTESGKLLHQNNDLEHHDMVTSLAFSSDGLSLYSSASNLIRWDIPHRKAVTSFGNGYVYGPCLSVDGKVMLFTEGSKTIRLTEPATGKVLHSLHAPRDDNWDVEPDEQPNLGSAHFAADGKSYYVMATKNGYQKNGQEPVPGWSQWLQVDVQSGKTIWQGAKLAQSHVTTVLRDGTTALSIETGAINAVPGTIRETGMLKTMPTNKPTQYCVLFDLRTHRRRSVFAMPDRCSYQFDNSIRGNTLLTCSSIECGKNDQGWNREEYTIYLWEPVTGKRRLTIPLREQSVLHWYLGKLVFSPDARRIAGFRIDGVVMIWDALTGEVIWEQATKLAKVQSAAFSPDGATLATGHEDSTIVLWNVGDLIRKPSAVVASAVELEGWWKDLGNPDAAKAYQSIWKLVDAGLPTTKYLQERVKPILPLNAAEGVRWIEQLDSKSFTERTEASQRLVQAGQQAETLLEQAFKQKLSPETHKRLEQIWNQQPVPSRDTIQLLRALEVLEHQHTEEARTVVTAISNGDIAHPVTQQAKIILYRWQ